MIVLSYNRNEVNPFLIVEFLGLRFSFLFKTNITQRHREHRVEYNLIFFMKSGLFVPTLLHLFSLLKKTNITQRHGEHKDEYNLSSSVSSVPLCANPSSSPCLF